MTSDNRQPERDLHSAREALAAASPVTSAESTQVAIAYALLAIAGSLNNLDRQGIEVHKP